jgi:transposase InsO family protein
MVTQSMGAIGVCWDSAVGESFFAFEDRDVLPPAVHKPFHCSHRGHRIHRIFV